MAIKVAGTEVISDARTFKVTGADGNYSDLKIGVTSVLSAISGTSSLSFSQTSDGVKSMKTYLSAGLSGDVTWALSSGSNPASGRSMTILVDASASGHDQSFTFTGGTILWPDDTEPDFSTARYWAHYITCWDATTASVLSTSWAAL